MQYLPIAADGDKQTDIFGELIAKQTITKQFFLIFHSKQELVIIQKLSEMCAPRKQING